MLHPDKAIAFGGLELETLRQRSDADENLLMIFEDLLNIFKGNGMRRKFAALKGFQLYPQTPDTVGDLQNSLLEGGLQGSQPGTKEKWYSPPETMQSSLASLDDFQDSEEGFSHV